MSIEELNGKKVVVKRNKPTKGFHEFLLIYTYSFISVILVHPTRPPAFNEIMINEGQEMRNTLQKIGISTPRLISISDIDLIEEYIEGGNLYEALDLGLSAVLAFEAGRLTGRMHNAGYAFVDNKAQNYLVIGDSVVRTDLGFTQETTSHYARSMDIGSFLASVIDQERYREIERSFFDGYVLEHGHNFSFLSTIIRNILSIGFSSDIKMTLKNMLLDAAMFIA